MSLQRITLPFIILIIGTALFFTFKSMKKPPEEKPLVDNTPIVIVEKINVSPITLEVSSYGVVMPKYETELVAQVSGQIVELSPLFVRGGFIKKGELLARIDPNNYNAALIDAEANMASAQASLEQERAQGKVAENEWKTITNSSPTELSLRKPQLAQELARVKSAQASILIAKRNLERTEIRAPYDSMIESRTIGLGSFVAVGSNVGKLLGTATAEIRLPVADNQLSFLNSGGVNSDVLLEGTYAGNKKVWNAKIVRDEGVIDSNSRMTYLVAEINDPYALTINNKAPVRFGSYVNAKILGLNISKATKIPRYLVEDNKVAILDAESRLHYAEVNIVRNDGNNVVITGGLNDGEQIIVSALDYPIEGMALTLADSNTEQQDNKDSYQNESETQVASNHADTGK